MRGSGSLLVDVGTEWLAWALLSNHVHLLAPALGRAVVHVHARLLTGYTVTFNRRRAALGASVLVVGAPPGLAVENRGAGTNALYEW